MGQGWGNMVPPLVCKKPRGKRPPLPPAAPLPHPGWSPLHRGPGGSRCLCSPRCFESTIMKSGCTVVNSTFYIYISYLSYIYKL